MLVNSTFYARVAQLVEHDLAKVGAAGSSPVSCSIETQKDIRKDVFFVFTSPAGARGFEVSAPLRSAQSGRPPDVLRRLVLLPKARKHCKINAFGFFAESKDIRTI